MNTDDYFCQIDLPVPMLPEILEFAKWSTENDKFYLSRFNVSRVDLPSSILNELKKILTYEISDAGIQVNTPGWTYKAHKDAMRQFAMNMLLTDPNPDFEIFSYPDDESMAIPVPYIKNKWLMLNTKKLHSIKNNSKTLNRHLMSIGCSDSSYHEVLATMPKYS
jgi:hypothetical protein